MNASTTKVLSSWWDNLIVFLPFLPPNDSQPICKSGKGLPFHRNLLREAENLCKLPCKKMTVYFGILEKVQETMSFLEIHLKSTVQYSETVMDYQIVSMLAGTIILQKKYCSTDYCCKKSANNCLWTIQNVIIFSEFGGYVGRLLGYSVLDLHTFMSWIVQLVNWKLCLHHFFSSELLT